MSDTTLPPQVPTEAAGVPHSGDLGLEHPEQDFDNTTLQEAVDKGLVGDTPDDASKLVMNPPEVAPLLDPATYNADRDTIEARRPRRARKLTAIGLVLGLAAGAAGVLGSRGGSDERRSDTAAGAVANDSDSLPTTLVPPKTETATPPETTPSTVPDAPTPEVKNAVANAGNLDLTRTLPGENYLVLNRDGQEYKVPSLRNPETDPTLAAEAVLANMAAFVTTGETRFMDALTRNDDVRARLERIRQGDMLPIQSDPNNAKAQLVITDFDSSPVKFELTADKNAIQLTSGQIEMGVEKFVGPWQGRAFLDAGELGNKIFNMTIVFEFVNGPDDKLVPAVKDFHWEMV
jgi:hypothetical protein